VEGGKKKKKEALKDDINQIKRKLGRISIREASAFGKAKSSCFVDCRGGSVRKSSQHGAKTKYMDKTLRREGETVTRYTV